MAAEGSNAQQPAGKVWPIQSSLPAKETVFSTVPLLAAALLSVHVDLI